MCSPPVCLFVYLPTYLSGQERYPEEFEKRVADKLNYRYPGVAGESYLDVIERVRPVIIELERQRRSIVIVCHVAVLRYVRVCVRAGGVVDVACVLVLFVFVVVVVVASIVAGKVSCCISNTVLCF
jgi:hypothetical protein